MSHNNTKKYIDILPDIIESYNHSIHTSLKNNQTPFDVHFMTDPKIIQKQFKLMYKYSPNTPKKVSTTLSVGQYVRISDEKRNTIFHKGYTIQNTLEIFQIKSVNITQKPTVYFLQDLSGEPIKGIFYRQELTPTNLPEFYNIHIIKSRTRSGQKQYFVKWIGYPDSFNSWIDQEQMKQI